MAQCRFSSQLERLEYIALKAIYNANPNNTLSNEWKQLANNQTCDGIAINDTCSTTGCVSVDFTITVVDATDTTGGSINLNINSALSIADYTDQHK